jgi:hypothetical protein
LGDGHDGIWNIIAAIAAPEHQREVLDWYHLNENLHKVGGRSIALLLNQRPLWLPSGHLYPLTELAYSLSARKLVQAGDYSKSSLRPRDTAEAIPLSKRRDVDFAVGILNSSQFNSEVQLLFLDFFFNSLGLLEDRSWKQNQFNLNQPQNLKVAQ